MQSIIVLILLISISAAFSGCAIEKKESTFLQKAITNYTESSVPVTRYNRKDWPHWIDEDKDCQNTRQELLITTSKVAVQFKNFKHCTVEYGRWYGVYTGKTFTKASDIDIDHIVPLAHAHRHGAENWTKEQRRAFANDFDNLLVVDKATNESKSSRAPHEWLPPLKSYWCEYGKRWQQIKNKYRLRYTRDESATLTVLIQTCS